MSLLQRAKNTTAFAKVGILGFPGSGKTYTAALIATGICKLIKQNRIAFFDTETGSDFLLSKLGKDGVEVYQTKSRSFGDICQWLAECEAEKIGVAIIDSITHVWRDLCESYDKKLNRRGRLQFQDWAVIKGEWKRYTDAYVNSRLHVIVCGRAGYEYDYDFNEDGSKDLIKTATRMKVESEFAFEPSLVIEMERTSETKEELKEHLHKSDRASKEAKQGHKPEVGSKWIHRAYVLKDRTDTLNGQVFDYPTFESFKAHFAALNIGGEHLGVDVSRTSEGLFDEKGRPDWKQRQDQANIALEEIYGELDRNLGTRGDDKVARLALLKWAFGTYSDTALKMMDAKVLNAGLDKIRDIFATENPKDAILEIVKEEKAKGRGDHEATAKPKDAEAQDDLPD